jgi:hypothetical protein
MRKGWHGGKARALYWSRIVTQNRYPLLLNPDLVAELS